MASMKKPKGPTPAPKLKVPSVPGNKKVNAPRKVTKSESLLRNKIVTGKVKDLNAARKGIAKKTGSWPNGMTN